MNNTGSKSPDTILSDVSGQVDFNRRFRTSDDYLLRNIAGEAILIPIGEGAAQLNGMVRINETFKFIWEQFQESKSIREVVSAAMENFEDTDGRLEADICRFVAESLRYGFLKEE